MSIFNHTATLQLLHCFSGSILLAKQLVAVISFLNSKLADTALVALDVRDMKVDLLV